MCTQCEHIDEVPDMPGITVVRFAMKDWRDHLCWFTAFPDMYRREWLIQEMVDVCALAARQNTIWLCEHGAHRSAFGLLIALVAAGHTYMSAYEQLRDTLCMQMLVYVTI